MCAVGSSKVVVKLTETLSMVMSVGVGHRGGVT
jgi:hypothetical protein